jgi:Ran GTPase-activating protein (RanGAP) involved in mRNA processing and transport
VLAKCLPDGLTDLNLSSNEIGDEGALALVVKPLPKGLTRLNLSCNYIGNEGALALAERLPPDLTDLDLSWNQIEDKGALTLANRLHEHRGITNFNLYANSITPEGEIAVRNILNDIPNLTFQLCNLLG